MSGPILVYAEQKDGILRKGATEAISEARRIADTLKTEVVVLIVGNNIQDVAREPAFYGANKVLIADNPAFANSCRG